MNQDRRDTDRDIAAAHRWLAVAAGELGVDTQVLRPLISELLDLTRDIAHGPSRPAAPLTTFLVGLSAGGAVPDDATPEQTIALVRERINRITRALDEHSREKDA